MTTTTAERVSVTAILADLILLQSRAGLPMPTMMRATASNGCLGLDVTTLEEVKAWHDALGGDQYALNTATYPDRGPIHSTCVDRSGWFVRIVASIRDLPAETLSAETLAELLDLVEPAAEPAGCEWTGGAGCTKLTSPDDHLCTGHREKVQSAVQVARAESAVAR
jgi:hypothetical protein